MASNRWWLVDSEAGLCIMMGKTLGAGGMYKPRNFTAKKYDPSHPKSPMEVFDDTGDFVCVVRGSVCTDEFMEVMDKAFELGKGRGKSESQREMRKAMGISQP